MFYVSGNPPGRYMSERPLIPWRVGFTPGTQGTRPLAVSCFCRSIVPPAGIEPAPQTGTDFESVAATITPRGFDWAFHTSPRSGPIGITFNIYSRFCRFVAPARIERASSEPKSDVLAVAPRGNLSNLFCYVTNCGYNQIAIFAISFPIRF